MAQQHFCQDIHEARRFRHFEIDTNANKISVPDSLPQRPAKFNNLGTEAVVTLNTFNVVQAPNRVVYQYDVTWGKETDATKRILVKKIWNSKACKEALGEPDNLWIYDGNKLAW
jgi:eukaryotic translation initiation factor 2C